MASCQFEHDYTVHGPYMGTASDREFVIVCRRCGDCRRVVPQEGIENG